MFFDVLFIITHFLYLSNCFVGAGGGNYTSASQMPFLLQLRFSCEHLAVQKSTGLFLCTRALSGSIPSVFWSWRRESNPQPADYKSAALPLSHASMCIVFTAMCPLIKMAIRNGLEPSTSSVTGWHSNQLNYRTAFLKIYLTEV